MPISDLLPWNREKPGYEPRKNDEYGLMDLRKEMNSMFDTFFGDTMHFPTRQRWPDRTDVFSPQVDISETDNELHITADLPGMDEKDIHLTIEGGQLVLSGKKEQETETRETHFHRIERSYGSFQRSITLPFDVDVDKVNASFDRGVLKVNIPKTVDSNSQVKKIPIRTR
jgi:HSP20 family protein